MIEQEKSSTVAFWCNHIDQYNKDTQSWYSRSKKIIKRYKDDRNDNAKTANKFNILWSNVQTLAPALYDKQPNPNIDRRFQSDDKLGTVSAQVLERAVSFFIDADEFNDVMRQVVLDRLLGGRGVCWIRYEPHFVTQPIEIDEADGVQVTDDQDDMDEEQTEEVLEREDVVADYVHWQDFGHTWAKTWQEVRAVWRIVPMSRKELIKRFGEEIGSQVPMDSGKKDDNTPEDYKRAFIYEIWDKETETVYWVCKDYKDVLDSREDPLKLTGFFPCPKPLYATITNDNLIPTPDYVLYQDQASELDDLTGRIGNLVKALRVAGVYDASAPALQKLLSEDAENILIPVEQWAVFGEKGGLKGVIDFLPIKEIGETLMGLYQARDRTKQELYEITGISDIIRGATNPNETLGAQELKGKYAGLRMGAMQADVARFARDIVHMFSEIIAEQFSLETIKEISGFNLFTEQEKATISQAQASGQQIDMPNLKEKLENPSWEQVIGLMKDNTARKFRISIETDSTIKQDQDAEKQSRTEFLTAAGGFIQQAVQVPNPELAPLLLELFRFGIKGFKVGREMETIFDVALKDIKAKSEQPPTPPPEDPSIATDKAKLEIEGAKLQQDAGFKQADLQLKAKDLEMKYALENKKIEADLVKSRIDAKSKVSPDLAMSDTDLNGGVEITPMQQMMMQLSETLVNGLQTIAQMQAQGNQAVVAAIQNPPAREVIRDASGNMIGVK